MDIIKRLQLNRNAKDIKSGSIVGAKNIMLDQTKNTITNEYGFTTSYEAPDGYEIKGCITCNEEICIFLYNKTTSKSLIQRLDDNGTITNIDCAWKWEGGKVIGSFSYNYNKELILAISEITNDESKNIPLKILNTKFGNFINLEEDIPQYNINYTVSQNGFLVCGVYTFFIRFVLDNNTYSKWFQITDDIIIINSIEKEHPHHYFDKEDNNNVGIADTNNFNGLTINTNEKSNKSIVLNINFKTENTSFSQYQIGYIIKHDSDIKGRILGNYNLLKQNNYSIDFSDNFFIEEELIDNFLEEPHQFYNVKNLINYNNRLYISNFNEYKKYSESDLTDLINSVKAKFKYIVVEDDTEKYYYELKLNANQTRNNKVNLDSQTTSLNNAQTLNLLRDTNFISRVDNEVTELLGWLYVTRGTSTSIRYTFLKGELYVGPSEYVTDINRLIKVATYTNEDPQGRPEYHYSEHWSESITIIKRNDSFYLKSGSVEVNLDNAKWALLCYTIVGENDLQYANWSHDVININNRNGITDRPTYWNTPNLKYSFILTETKIITDINQIGVNYNNNRTLIPGQIYNFYIHFVRKDLSYTEGYKIIGTGSSYKYIARTTNFIDFPTIRLNNEIYFFVPFVDKLTSFDINKAVIAVPQFSVNSNKLKQKDFIGYFVSYEKVERTIINVVPVGKYTKDGLNYIEYTNTELLYNSDYPNGKQLQYSTAKYDVTGNYIRNIKNKSDYSLPYREKHIKLNFEDYDIDVTEELNSYKNIYNRHSLYTENNNIYKSKIKTLYQLTPITFIGSSNDVITDENTCYQYLPGFFNNEKVITYNKELVLSSTQNKVYGSDGSVIKQYAIKAYIYSSYSELPLNAFSLKQDYEKGAVTINNKVYANSVLSPSKLSDFLEIKEAYTSKPLKSFVNYQNSTIDRFDKTIYRSDIISDESLNNGFRHFSIENYKNIIENKGNITNIVGIGLYLLVHTEYSLFIFDRNNQLTKEAQLQIPDVFDIDYKEVIPSGEGFGGLKDKDEAILTKYGYIWLDRVGKNIFMFDGKELKLLSSDIHSLLEHIITSYNVKVVFAEDYISNRLLVCIYIVPTNAPGRVPPRPDPYVHALTLSYSFDTNTFISTHDYSFNNNYKTYNNSYLYSEKCPTKLFSFSKYEESYKDLGDVTQPFIFNKIQIDNKDCSYVDIIFTDKYEISKTLNSISYILNKRNKFSVDKIDNYFDNIFDKYYNTNYDRDKHLNALNLYSGFKLYITTDLCFSGLLDISQPNINNNDDLVNNINTLNSTKPHWNSGIWDFNNFRENLNKDVTNEELKLIETITYYDSETGQLKTKKIDLNELKAVYNNGNGGYDKSDMRSLIVGKYFILRFIFERTWENLNIKFETVDINISKL